MGLFKSSDQATRPRFVELRSSKWFITFVVSFALATDIFMYGLIVPVTPTALKERVGVPPEKIQAWTSVLLALFSASMLAFSPIVGYITDRAESRKWPYLFGLTALAAATGLLCVGSTIGFWIAGRLFQGAAGAVVWIVGIALMADAVGRNGLGQAIGYMSMAASVGTLAGPLLGGVLYEKCGYYSVFGLAFGLIGLDILLRFMLIERKDAIKWLAPEMRPLVPAPVETGAPTDSPPRGVLERMGFLISSSRLMAALWGNFVVALFLSSFDSVLPLFVQGAFQWQQSGQGLIFIPLIVPHVFDPVTGYIIDKFPRSARYITAGAFFIMTPLLVLLQLVTDNSMHDKIVLCALLGGIGLCLSVALPPLDVEVFNIVEEKERQRPGAFGAGGATALAFGLTSMGFSAGNLVGPFFAGFIRQEAGWGTMSWALGLMAMVSGIPILLFMGGWILSEPVNLEDEGPDSVTVSEP
ncbi:Velvet factor [Penicillium atrosanguineum]|uniref:Major facilitator superfamily (MFS) profile domain-containing protein n=1 Tax=Penicillium atrosanguineum TaxID=1132637 RepID=A0A9W9PQF4_9EURO|nr:Velvet factor [Penicillium atrosanguineum]KAJ5126127.1 hypothetical protein N7526_008304 [Penicillium atrosanguineum]KAJ5293215.1 Velvet factor [Penicillium atrosanguineum]KAJ5302749.1 hypothetical protein N7476_009548 [Penicillium atrosanguineum]